MAGERGKPTRREVLKLAAGAAAAVPMTPAEGLWQAGAALAPSGAPRFFTRDQLALVDALAEIVIPADEHSGGARAAHVATEIDRRLADTVEGDTKKAWMDGLSAVESLARERHARAFLQLAPDEQEAIVGAMAEEESRPATPAGRFFVELKRLTVDAYYTSKVGIHDDIEYKGNTVQAEYSGIDVSRTG